ncbi:ralBP1-associated Eps domain-containing protein 1-like [Argiope bruennichi]|uniref:RalBP1-associated Eps domain-containing n=1 Tax=Argiope bruennichi TaxID=94029 RepID=A0A8T0G0V8_ARGBR|nr:ralBP1-associated Eps domain-containing protein 1-like [Argiope bruennichi]XP_055947335.1 ralBP1-associated Eps domain-containing protein 1-like [Argiope bruennichi]KAF8796987.1 RalBP1-associated Eps domain-containing [Argiope bruennichi]
MNDISCSNMLENRNVANASHIITVLPPPPTKSHRGSLSAGSKQSSLAIENEISPSHQPPIQVAPHVIVPPVKKSDSPCSSPTDTAASPRSSLSTERSWSFFNKEGSTSWTNFEEHHQLLGNDEENSERHSSDDDFDIWSITDEQREYYVNQFKSMQPDLKKKITGATAKEFFEKSKLPVIELSKIWQLSDVDKDGALSIEEFCTAMHLVVLRRNNIDLPDVLPPSLVPKVFQKTTEADVNIPNQAQTVPTQSHVSSPKQTSPSELVSPQSKEWTKFNDSPTSSLSSPGMKPVNFDFSAASVEQDPKILHPVALRLSPERQAYSIASEKEQATAALSSTLMSQSVETNSEAVNVRVHSSSFSGTSDASKSGNIASQVGASLPQGPKKEPPPPPPPRPKHNHIRSSSLDLNKLGKTVPHFLGAPPAVPPRVSPSSATPHKSSAHSDEHNQSESIDFADFTNFDDNEVANLQLKSGAFEVYKKPLTAQERLQDNSSAGSETYLLEQSTLSAAIDDSTALLVDISHQDEEAIGERQRHPSEPPLALTAANITSVPRDKRELQAAIKAHRVRNMMLTLLNNELNQELSEIMEERIALEIQLEHLKQFS